jgi:hypothetical protein
MIKNEEADSDDITVNESITDQLAISNFIQELEKYAYRNINVVITAAAILQQSRRRLIKLARGDRMMWNYCFNEWLSESLVYYCLYRNKKSLTTEEIDELTFIFRYLRVTLYNNINLLDTLNHFVSLLPSQELFRQVREAQIGEEERIAELRSLINYFKGSKYIFNRQAQLIEYLSKKGLGIYISKEELREGLFKGEVSESNLFRIISEAKYTLEKSYIDLGMKYRFDIRCKSKVGYAIFVEEEQ